jgi:hypothetical protein
MLSAARERGRDVKQALTSFVSQARNHLTACTPVSLLSPSTQTTDDDDDVDGPSVPSLAKTAPEAACRPGALVETPLSVGQEVIRGPNWAWGGQDGFEEGDRVAATGVVMEIRSNGWIKVRWRRTSMLETYRAGKDVVPYSEAAWLQKHPVPHPPTAMSPHPAQGHEEKKDGNLGVGAAGGVAPAAGVSCSEHEMHGNGEAERSEPPASCNEGQTLQCNADEAERGISARAQGDRDADRSAETGGEQEEAAAEPPCTTNDAAESGACGQQAASSSMPPPLPPTAPASRFSSILAMGKSAASKAASAMREEAALLSKDLKQMSDDAGKMTAGTLLLASASASASRGCCLLRAACSALPVSHFDYALKMKLRV